MPIVELATWVISDAYVKDSTILEPAIDFFKAGVDGCRSIHYGIAEEDQKTMYMFIVWESLEHHKALMARPGYPLILGLRPAIGEGGLTMRHIDYLYDFVPALTAPVTEMLLMTLKEGKTKEDLDAILLPLGKKIDAKNPNNGPANQGQILEDPRQFCVTIGWDSIQAHTDCIGEESFQPLIQGLRDTTEPTLVHVALKTL